jgi:hypothetical protein
VTNLTTREVIASWKTQLAEGEQELQRLEEREADQAHRNQESRGLIPELELEIQPSAFGVGPREQAREEPTISFARVCFGRSCLWIFLVHTILVRLHDDEFDWRLNRYNYESKHKKSQRFLA